jgi:hypothetical protein
LIFAQSSPGMAMMRCASNRSRAVRGPPGANELDFVELGIGYAMQLKG